MKRNRSAVKNYILTEIIILISGCLLIIFVDNVTNGMFREWFYSKFMVNIEAADGTVNSVFRDWGGFQLFMINLFLSFLMISSTISILLMNYFSQKKRREDVAQISEAVGKVIDDTDESVVLPEEYGQIQSKIILMKSQAERQEQLMKKEAQRKTDLITYLAHDMRTPLASVIGYLSLLCEASDMPGEQRSKYLGVTLDKACRLEQLIEEFFEITRFNLQDIVVNYEQIDMKLLFEQMADEFYPIIEPDDKQIEVKTPEKLLLYGDGDKLARVFNNIIKNAVMYSYAGSKITIEAEEKGAFVRIRFVSHGDPIPEHQREQIFEKFFRLDTARSSRTGGAGLGLAIAKEIVDAHKGEITVDSDKERTVFTVELPCN